MESNLPRNGFTRRPRSSKYALSIRQPSTIVVLRSQGSQMRSLYSLACIRWIWSGDEEYGTGVCPGSHRGPVGREPDQETRGADQREDREADHRDGMAGGQGHRLRG